MDSIKEAVSTPLIEKIDQLIEDIYEQRKVGIAEGGEYDQRNLLFKEFRNKGYLDNLKTLRLQLVSKELSLESLEPVKDSRLASSKAVKAVDESLSRGFMESEILKVKPYYKLAHRTDAEIYNIYKYIQAENRKNQEEIELLNSINAKKEIIDTCENCGAQLNDQKECPVCDLGEEDLLEKANIDTYTVLWDDEGEIYYTGLTKNVPLIYWTDNENVFKTEAEMEQFINKIIKDAGREDEFYVSEELRTAKDFRDIKEKFYRILGGGYQPLLQQSGRFDFYNLNETDANYIVNTLRGQDFIDFVYKAESKKYNFNAMSQFGIPKKYYTVYGNIKS